MPTNPHDVLVKKTLANPENAEGKLRAILPAKVATLVDWSTLKTERGSFVDLDAREWHTDLLFSAKLAGREALLYLLLEHQSTVDPWMPLWMLTYMGRRGRPASRSRARSARRPRRFGSRVATAGRAGSRAPARSRRACRRWRRPSGSARRGAPSGARGPRAPRARGAARSRRSETDCPRAQGYGGRFGEEASACSTLRADGR